MTKSSGFKAWVQASRLPSQSYIAFPLLLGQVLAWHVTGQFSWWIFALVMAFGVFDQLYIVYANDYADRQSDQHNEQPTPFSGGSRVLVEGRIQPAILGRAAIVMALLAMLTTATVAAVWQHFLAVPLGAFGLLLLWAYSYPPFRLSYRGGGEFLQTIGVGGVLPILAYYCQAGTVSGFPWEILVTLLALNLANAISTALPDRPADLDVDKRTIPVLIGQVPAQILVIGLHALGLAAFWWLGLPGVDAIDGAALAVLGVSALALLALVPLAPKAKPGTTAIVAFVALSILVNLAWVTAVIVALLTF